ncbi:MAG: response regulator [Candidatus Dechloromonas phosphoritropha]|nr:response regulator [Candidatus Dechloromonas phosphoritropha]
MNTLSPLAVVVEDEPQIRRFVCSALRDESCRACEAGSVAQGLDLAARERPDLVVLDLGLPDRDGVDFIRELRVWSTVPILVLSARSDESDKIAALDAGADDYLTKPFGVGELRARVRAMLRRNQIRGNAGALHAFGDVEADLARHVIQRAGAEVHLTLREYNLLVQLLSNPGRVLTHGFLIDKVWGPANREKNHYLRIYVGRLRQKLETDPTRPRHILTETGVGYRFQP